MTGGDIESRLHKYQSEAIAWIVDRLCSGLFLSPGLGKTLIVLMAFRLLRLTGKIEKMFVVAPLRVCYLVWPREVEKWGLNFSVGILHGPDKEKVLNEDHDIYVINPHGLAWFSKRMTKAVARDWFGKLFWLVVDESSQFRNGRSQRFKALKHMLKYFDRRTILTGTPAPNGLEGLWGQIYLLDSGDRLGAYITAYRNRFFYPSGYGGYTYLPQEGAKEKIYKAIDDIVMHKGRDVLDLPPLVNNSLRVQLPAKAQKIYDEMNDEFIAEVGDRGIVAAINGAVASGKLREIAGGNIYGPEKIPIEIHDEKIKALEELIDELEGQPLMVFYEFNHERDRLLSVFDTARYFGKSKADDEAIERDWNSGAMNLLFLNPASAGHGLNLQESACRDICWYTPPWDLELYEQAFSRVWRQGVGGSVTMHHIIANGTMDEIVMRSLDRKTKLQDELKAALTK